MNLRSRGRRVAALCCALVTGGAVLYVALAWPMMSGG